jgi:hypothetical protein
MVMRTKLTFFFFFCRCIISSFTLQFCPTLVLILLTNRNFTLTMMLNDFHARKYEAKKFFIAIFRDTWKCLYTYFSSARHWAKCDRGGGRGTVELCLLEGSQVWLDFSLGNWREREREKGGGGAASYQSHRFTNPANEAGRLAHGQGIFSIKSLYVEKGWVPI